MSHGPGNVQRRLSAVFASDPGPHATGDLTVKVYDVPDEVEFLTMAQMSSVRRALCRMVKAGIISSQRGAGGQKRWATPQGWARRDEETRRIVADYWAGIPFKQVDDEAAHGSRAPSDGGDHN